MATVVFTVYDRATFLHAKTDDLFDLRENDRSEQHGGAGVWRCQVGG